VNHYAVPAEPKFIMNARMLEDRSGALWVAPPRYGLFRVKDGVVTGYTQRLGLSAPATIMRILEDADGSLWFATLNAGLLHFSNNAAETVTSYTTTDGLSSNGIRGLFRDPDAAIHLRLFGSAGVGRQRRACGFGGSRWQCLGGDA
jgi:ligand-binding sensor domain-containing protein